MRWSGFMESGGDLATRGNERLRSTGLCLVGTIRADGWPRISPCEVILEEGELILGMHWRSRKALDLLRDPRLTVHSTQCDPQAANGDFKLYGRAIQLPDDGTDPTRPRPSQLFAVDVERAAFISFREHLALVWDAGRGVRQVGHPHIA
jgi:hypothetical protein